jgi:hypothetical protein
MNTGPSGVANRGLTFVFDIRHKNWYVATKIRVFEREVLIARIRDSRAKLKQSRSAAGSEEIIRGTDAQTRIIRRHCWPEEDVSRDRSPGSNNSKALLARRR